MENKAKKRKTLSILSVTPMLSHGANKRKPEIRIPEIKSAMRFWWRALNWFDKENTNESLKNLNKQKDSFDYVEYMKLMEGKIFGDSKNNASPISVKLNRINVAKKEEYKYNIHGGKTVKLHGFKNVNFEIVLSSTLPFMLEELKGWNFENYNQLLEIISVIGGIGQRSRRAYGAFKIDSSKIYSDVNKLSITNKINELFPEVYGVKNSKYVKGIEVIARNDSKIPSCQSKFPYVEEIFIGKETIFEDYKKSIKIAIGKNFDDGNKYMTSESKRYACPVYISVCYKEGTEKIVPVITVLHNTQIQEGYKEYEKYKQYVSNIVRECIK